jgi:perosamine synthetase
MEAIPLAQPDITDLERRAVEEVLLTPTLSLGPKLPEFEALLAEAAGVRHAVAVNSGTAALHLAVRGLGIGPGDEVITTPFSFIASANAVLFEGARPVLVDIDPRTLNLDPARLEAALTSRTKAVLAVDVFGHPADWDAIEAIARPRGLAVIEDSCEAIGARYKGRRAGSFGDCGAFAFYPNKQITTGEGGALVTDSGELAALARSMRNQGRSAGGAWLAHERLGYNYRLSEINCALGVAQMHRLEDMLRRRAEVAEGYRAALSAIDEIELPYAAPDVEMSWFVYVVRLRAGFGQAQRDAVLASLRAKGIGCSNYFAPIHLQPFYRAMGWRPGDFPVTESVGERTIALPFFNALSRRQIEAVAEALAEAVAEAAASQESIPHKRAAHS